jgi:MFS family permease
MMAVAALAMVGTLPGRTQGLGLITEPLLKDLSLHPVDYAKINLWATLVGSLFSVGIGPLQDRIGSRIVLTTLTVTLGLTVIAMSRASGMATLFVLITLTRGLGQSALSVVSLTMVGQWFQRRLNSAMAVYTIVMSIGFMIAFPLIGALVTQNGWRFAWAGIGGALLLFLAPLALLLVRRSPESVGLSMDGSRDRTAEPSVLRDDSGGQSGSSLREALQSPAFWVMATSSALYGLIASGIGLFNESVLKERGFDPAIYHQTLAVTALTALAGNFLAGFLARKRPMNRLMSVAMLLLLTGLLALPNLRTYGQAMGVAVVMGIAGGFVMVLFFSFWGRAYGRAHLGKIQGAAQAMTVLASAVGPLLLAKCVDVTGSYAMAFYLLAGVMALLAVAAWRVRVPGVPAESDESLLP